MKKLLSITSLALVALLVLAPAASAQNLLANPGMEDGPTGYGVQDWIVFGNVYTEANNGYPFVAYEGTQMMSFFGPFAGGFGVSGMFQEFETAEGDELSFSVKSRHHDADPMIGSKATGGNWVVQKLAFFDVNGTEIFGVESDILDGSWATEVWHDNAPITAVTPAGAVKVQALVLYLQPGSDGGSAQIDAAVLTGTGAIPTKDSSWGAVKSLYR